MSVYDVNGFVVAVEGSVDKVFSEEYGYFKISKAPQKIDLFVKVNGAQRFLPTRTYRSPKGAYIPYGEDENTLWYEEGIERELSLDHFLERIEFLMWWPDRAWLHAGAVARKGKAYVFTGESGVGKTSSVLNLLNEGYDYLGDDWLTIAKGEVFPLPKRIRVFGHNLKYNGFAKRAFGYRRLYYLPMCELLEYCSKFPTNKYARLIFGKLRERTLLSVEIQEMFPEAKVASPSSISKVFLLERKKADRIEVKSDLTSEELAQKMAYYSMYWWNHVLREYYFYVHLFGIRNKRIEYRLYHDVRTMNEAFGECALYRVIVPLGLDLCRIDLPSQLGID